MASPPHVPNLNLPRKRPSISSTTSTTKKRKPSQLRNVMGPESERIGSPLRYSRSPSVDSSIAGSSLINSGPGGRKRRKKDNDADARSVTSTNLKAGSAAGTSALDADGNEEEEDDDEEGEGEGEAMDTILLGEKMTEAHEKQEMEHRRILMEAMNPNQTNRYETYRRVKLKKEIVRKITNQTLSQSVPQPVIIAINGYTKCFIGELIDRAITVRDEWLAARSVLPNPKVPVQVLQAALSRPGGYEVDAKPSVKEMGQLGVVGAGGDAEGFWVPVDRNLPVNERVRMRDKGPLTPDHLREALRRYKRDRDGGGAGFAGLSLEGVERTAGRMGGRRLFR